jgi:hypothetical protein
MRPGFFTNPGCSNFGARKRPVFFSQEQYSGCPEFAWRTNRAARRCVEKSFVDAPHTNAGHKSVARSNTLVVAQRSHET